MKQDKTICMKEEINIAINGANEEKKILTERLSQLNSSNTSIATRSSTERRLREIDKFIQDLIKPEA